MKHSNQISMNLFRLQHAGQSLHEHESDEKQSSQQRQNDSATIYYEVNKMKFHQGNRTSSVSV